MCGITGKLFFDPRRPVDPTELKKMTDVIRHRGPDDEGYYVKNNVGLGFRRLSIIDLKGGHQPLSNLSGNLWITFNGEIYNFRELRADLIKQGYKFKTQSDTEVIVNLYAEYGENCVDYLRGMFAFVIWDETKKQLFGARDRFGIKPFFYFMDHEKFIYGSELKSIITSTGIKKELDIKALDSYFSYGYIMAGRSIYTTIHKLPPAHSFILKPLEKSFYISRYWKISFEPDYSRDEQYWISSLQEALEESVKMRMISDVPLGAFLSGGIDSSSVVAMMAKNSNRPIKTFSIGFKEEAFNELPYARMVAKKYQTEHYEQIIEPESFGLLPKLVEAYDEPFADSSAIPTYYVSKFAREHVTVTLSGDGGDELFAGYQSYSKMMRLRQNPLSGSFLNQTFFTYLNRMLPDYMFGKGYSYYLSKNIDHIGAYFCMWKNYERQSLFKPDILKELNGYKSEDEKILLLEKDRVDFLSKMQKLDMQTYMVDDILTKVDRASMMNSLESRVPLLDHKLAELSFKMPVNLKWNKGNKKYILKESMRAALPEGILNHKKKGFSIPLKLWFKDDLKSYTADVLSVPSSPMYDYLNFSTVQKMFNDHQKGQRTYGSKIWSLLFFNEWLRQREQ